MGYWPNATVLQAGDRWSPLALLWERTRWSLKIPSYWNSSILFYSKKVPTLQIAACLWFSWLISSQSLILQILSPHSRASFMPLLSPEKGIHSPNSCIFRPKSLSFKNQKLNSIKNENMEMQQSYIVWSPTIKWQPRILIHGTSVLQYQPELMRNIPIVITLSLFFFFLKGV